MKKGLSLLAAAAVVFAAGWFFAPSGGKTERDPHEGHDTVEVATIWTCSMHPQVRQPNPGSCPICGMDLIPIAGDDDDAADDADLPRLRLSNRAIALMNIQTVPVQRREAHVTLRLPGLISADETRLYTVSAWFSGRVDRLFADFAGTRVAKGEHLLEIYSPQLFGAQEEYLQALRSSRERADNASRSLAGGARQKLSLLGLNEAQIETLEATGEATTHLTYFSPVDGIVTRRNVTTGQYVDTGTPLYTVTDLSRVWVELEAYESELERLRYGQPVAIEVLSHPGETFDGRIAHIYPEIDARQRTARVRVDLPNEDLRLKPGMLAIGIVKARVGEKGIFADSGLEGKWISPMHPQIVKDTPGFCDVCGMPLVPVEQIGYFASGSATAVDPLVIPATAPLHTGKRAIVYVRVPETERPTFEARKIKLGSRLGDVYPVLDGLVEGELVVAHGQFKIDSELQIRGRPSMMAPGGGGAPLHDHGGKIVAALADPRDEPEIQSFAQTVNEDFATELLPLFEGYLTIVEGLADDNLNTASEGLKAVHDQLLAIGQHRHSDDAHVAWMLAYERLHDITHAMADPITIQNFRGKLQNLTTVMESIHVNFGSGRLPVLNRAFCPMVNGDEIGTWLQRGNVIRNPYWGESMLRCGEVFGKLGNNQSQHE